MVYHSVGDVPIESTGGIWWLLVAFVFRICLSIWHTFVLALILPYPIQIECLQDEAYIRDGNRTTQLTTGKNVSLVLY